MDEVDLYARVGLALAIGLMVGIERGWHSRAESEGQRVAGIRTFTLIGLLGGVIGALADEQDSIFLAAAFAAVTALVIVAYLGRLRVAADIGMTTQVAAVATFALGLLAVLGDMAVAAAAGVIMTALLAGKGLLHRWIERVDRLELSAGIQLLVISVVLLPVLPNRGFGPGEAINPYALWWIVVLLSALSFVGYIAVRIAGPNRGILATALLGGLVSSIAVTLHFSRLARRDAALAPVLSTGVVVASATMFVRVPIIVGILNWHLLTTLIWPMGFMAAAAAALTVLFYRRHARGAAPTESAAFSNPLELGPALGFALFLAVVVVAGQLLHDWAGDRGLYALAAVAGLGDVDAVTVLMTQMSAAGLALAVATAAVSIAAFVNTAIKAGIVAVVAPARMARQVALAVAAIIAAGGVGLALA
jgi:uncharacterized membrane protein (DUF4010 family)